MSIFEDKKVAIHDLRRVCDPLSLPGLDGVEQSPLLGQERAIGAIEFARDAQDDVFNVFVVGPEESGKTTIVKRLLAGAPPRGELNDWCYVHNFGEEKSPRWLSFPKGQAKIFKADVERLINFLLLKLTVEKNMSAEHVDKINELVTDLDEEAKKNQCRVCNVAVTQQETVLGVWYEDEESGKFFSRAAIEAGKCSLPSEQEKKRLLEIMIDLEKKFKEIERHFAHINKAMGSVLEDEEKISELKLGFIAKAFQKMTAKYANNGRVAGFLLDFKKDIEENLSVFDLSARLEMFSEGTCKACDFRGRKGCPIHGPKGFFSRYEVNVLIDNSEREKAPVVVRNFTTYKELFGSVRVEPAVSAGNQEMLFKCDHTMISPGALHEANGGYLVLKFNDLILQQLFLPIWQRLIHTLKSGSIKMDSLPTLLGFETRTEIQLNPEPIPVDVRVILIGSNFHADHFLQADTLLEFTRLFKVRAQMEPDMSWSAENVKGTLSYLKFFCQKESLKSPDPQALARVIEFSSEIAQGQKKLTLRVMQLKTLLKEANYHAVKQSRENITLEDVEAALSARRSRVSLLQERYQEFIDEGVIRIDVDDEVVGQINGLAVYQTGDHVFGQPSRIVAKVFLGKKGVVSIEREIKAGLMIHNKGVETLVSFFHSFFGQKIPLTFGASIAFEQSYGHIDGDSASSTELYALLSAFADVPIKQGIAVTGSVDQHGNVQAIGGVNYKIKGFFDTCKERGLTGNQGVMIPQTNVRDLMLDKEVVKAVEEGQFHIWAVSRIEEGMEILTGKSFVHTKNLVEAKLEEMAHATRDFFKETKEN